MTETETEMVRLIQRVLDDLARYGEVQAGTEMELRKLVKKHTKGKH